MSRLVRGVQELADVQAQFDVRGLPIDRVGVRGLAYPITVLDREKGIQSTVGNISLAVSLPHDLRGTHMSRFIEIFERHRGELTIRTLPRLLDEMRGTLSAESAEIEIRFPYFLEREAPVTRKRALLEYRCAFRGVRNADSGSFTLEVTVPVSTVCPCSREISDYGAHNQRGYVSAEVRSQSFQDNDLIWIEELVDWIEASASAPIYPLLKREDERHVTMQAYDNPRFVEDVAREVAGFLKEDQRVAWFHVKVENLESIHNHSAFAEIEWHRQGSTG